MGMECCTSQALLHKLIWRKLDYPEWSQSYLPHSYNFSGNVFIVNAEKLIELKGRNTEIMKYIVSGGVSGSINLKKYKDQPN